MFRLHYQTGAVESRADDASAAGSEQTMRSDMASFSLFPKSTLHSETHFPSKRKRVSFASYVASNDNRSSSKHAMSATSPPHSPLPKRVKLNPSSPSQPQPQSIDATMSAAESTVPVTKVDAEPPLLIKKLSEKGRLPTRGSPFAAGYDIYASKDTVVPSRGKALIDTDISMAVPAGTCLFAFSSLFFPSSSIGPQLIWF